jgi:hypothetical protein
MGKQINRVFRTPLWNTELPPDKRVALFTILNNAKPSDIDKFEEITARYITFPTKLAGMVMYGILTALHAHITSEEDKMRTIGSFAMFIVGGIGIGGTRHANLGLDCIFRCIFLAGFASMLHSVSEVSDIVLIKSLR